MSRRARIFAMVLYGLLAGAACGGPTVTEQPSTWKRSTPEEQGIHSEALIEILERVRDEDVDLHSLILIRNDHVILECYVHPYDEHTLHNVKSVSKSIISALTGIALREGILSDLDQTVYELFPEVVNDDMDPRKKQITLRHLLTMTAGLDLDENGPKMAKIFASPDWIEAAFAQPMAHDPGERFVYSTPLTHTMSGILTEASGMSLLELAQQHLFGPLGIDDVQWRQGPKGYYFGGAELFMTPRDMAKFGLLYSHEGRWQGEQIVPAEWVQESTRQQLDGNARYGYWWWPTGDGGYDARGWGGQIVTVKPQVNLIAVGTAADFAIAYRLFGGFGEYEPSDAPLPPNPEANAKLQALIRELAHPVPRPVPEPPARAKEISGIEYALDANPRGFERIAFEFPGGSAGAITLGLAGESLSLDVGLDGVYRVSDMGALGRMPQENRVANRGEWTGPDTFLVESHEIGNPMHSRMTVVFDGDGIEVTSDVRPTGQRVAVKGRKAAAEP